MIDTTHSALQNFLKDWPRLLALEPNNYTVSIGSGAPTIQFYCKPEKSLLHGIRITRDDKRLDDLPINLVIRGDNSAFDKAKEEGAVGYLEFFEPIKTDDGVVNDPAMVNGVVVISNESFESVLALLLKGDPPGLLAVDVRGLEPDSPFGAHWNVSRSSRLAIVEFRFVLRDQPIIKESNSYLAALTRIEALLAQLQKLVQQGIRIRFFS